MVLTKLSFLNRTLSHPDIQRLDAPCSDLLTSQFQCELRRFSVTFGKSRSGYDCKEEANLQAPIPPAHPHMPKPFKKEFHCIVRQFSAIFLPDQIHTDRQSVSRAPLPPKSLPVIGLMHSQQSSKGTP